MAEKVNKWMQEAFSRNQGSLHRMLGLSEDEKIPCSVLRAAANKRNADGSMPLIARRARAALNARKDCQ